MTIFADYFCTEFDLQALIPDYLMIPQPFHLNPYNNGSLIRCQLHLISKLFPKATYFYKINFYVSRKWSSFLKQ
jgi:hypothetical protein